MKFGFGRLSLFASLAGLLLTGCSHVALRSNGLHPKPLPAEIEKEFACPKAGDFDPKAEVLEQTSAYVRKRIFIKPPPGAADGVGGTNSERRIGMEYYDLRAPGRHPVV